VVQPYSSVVMGMALVSFIDIGFLGHISGSPRGGRSATISGAMLRAIMEGQSGMPLLCKWNASSSGQFMSLVAVQAREARGVTPRAPWSMRMCVHELMVAEQ